MTRRRREGRQSVVWLMLAALGVAHAVVGATPAVAVPIARVVIEGNSRVDAEAIRIHVESRAGAELDPATVDRDVRSIFGMGFFDDVGVERRAEEAGTILVFRVIERPLVREIQVRGNDKIDDDDLEAAFKVHPRTILDAQKVRRGIDDAKKLYEEKGYLDVEITPHYTKVPDTPNNEVVVTYMVNEGEIVRIQEIAFEGNDVFSDRRLRGVITTKTEWFLSGFTGAGVMNAEALKTDTERVTAYYYDNGYITVRVDEPKVERRDDGLYVTFKVDEGEVFVVGDIQFAGDVRADLELRDGLDLRPGEVFRSSQLRKDILKITDRYGDVGYAFVNIEPETAIDQSAQKVDVTYKIDQGPEVTIDKIIITGNTKTRDKVLRRELKVHEQERFSGTKLKKSRDALNRLGFFQEVNLTTRRGRDESKLNLQVDVKEGQTGALTAGAGFSSADSLLFNARITENNLFGRGQRAVVNADFGAIRQNFILSFTEPYLFDIPLIATADAFSWRLDFDDFTREGTGAGLRFLYPVVDIGYEDLFGWSLEEVRIGAEYRIEQTDITDIARRSPPSIVAEEGRSLTSSLRPILSRDTLNSRFDPTRGSSQEFSFEIAGLGGDSEFFKVDARTRHFWPIYKLPGFGTFVYSIAGTLGYGQGKRGQSGSELPLFERYFPGGIHSIRGFQARTLGPREVIRDAQGRKEDTDPIGGSRQFVLNNEFIFPIVEPLGLKGVLFFDAGNAFLDDDGWDLGEVRYAVGGGIRWLSPLGPVRIELGIPLNKDSEDKTSVILFSFGAPL